MNENQIRIRIGRSAIDRSIDRSNRTERVSLARSIALSSIVAREVCGRTTRARHPSVGSLLNGRMRPGPRPRDGSRRVRRVYGPDVSFVHHAHVYEECIDVWVFVCMTRGCRHVLSMIGLLYVSCVRTK